MLSSHNDGKLYVGVCRFGVWGVSSFLGRQMTWTMLTTFWRPRRHFGVWGVWEGGLSACLCWVRGLSLRYADFASCSTWETPQRSVHVPLGCPPPGLVVAQAAVEALVAFIAALPCVRLIQTVLAPKRRCPCRGSQLGHHQQCVPAHLNNRQRKGRLATPKF